MDNILKAQNAGGTAFLEMMYIIGWNCGLYSCSIFATVSCLSSFKVQLQLCRNLEWLIVLILTTE